MKNHYGVWYLLILTIVAFPACNVFQQSDSIYSHIPKLECMPGEWVSADTADMEPSIRNFLGQALTNRDLTSVSWFVSAPYSGGYHTGRLKVNGEIPEVNSFRWQVFQAQRKAENNGLEMISSTRMPIGKKGIMWEVTIKNSTSEAQKLDLDLDLIGFNSQYDGVWQWWYPYPTLTGKRTDRDEEVENVRKYFNKDFNSLETTATVLVGGKPEQKQVVLTWPTDGEILNSKQYSTNINDNVIVIKDKENSAITSFALNDNSWNLDVKNSGAIASKSVELAAGEEFTFSWSMLVGNDSELLVSQSKEISKSFDSEFSKIEQTWKNRWQNIFKPNNELISGAFPILATDDSLASRVYYTGPLTMLYLTNTNLPQHEKVFLTGGPRWGASITFFWDITEWSTLWAVVDPDMMKEHLTSWILIDPSSHYGMDNISGKGVGNGYSANYWALFQMIRAYITVSGDYGYLDQKVDGKSVLEHLEKYALNWQNISIYGQLGAKDDTYKLADFGDDEWNLLEAVPTYKHIVPSFNAAYVWMMRETADLFEIKGEQQKANDLRDQANQMIQRILKLYAGNGVWNSLYPNGKTVEVRHSLDFMFLGRYTAKDIPNDIQREMIDFLYDELITDHWMRAQSLKDIAAKDSDRPDHGPLGAFDGWPAGTMDALSQLGYPDKAYDFYRNIAPVTREGIWAQAHELWGENKEQKNARVRIAQRGWHNRESSAGIGMSQVMLKNFFGFYPQAGGKHITIQPPANFKGDLYNVKFDGKYHHLRVENGNVEVTELYK